MKMDQAKCVKEFEPENERLRKALSELTPDKLILKEVIANNIRIPSRKQGGGPRAPAILGVGASLTIADCVDAPPGKGRRRPCAAPEFART